MSAAVLLLGFLNMILDCAITILVAFILVWICTAAGYPPSADVMKWGKIVVGLICLIIIVSWLLSLTGVLGAPLSFHILR